MLHTPSEHIGSVVPLYGAGEGTGGGGGSTRDHQSPSWIVGNALAGDTIDICDFLDPGDGTGIVAAIAAADADPGGRRHVFVRSGLYLLAQTIVVPRGVRLQGAGFDQVLFGVPGTNRLALRVDNTNTARFPAEISSFFVYVLPANPGAVGTEVLDLSLSTASRIAVLFDDGCQDAIADESLLRAFYWSDAPNDTNAILWQTDLIVIGGISRTRAALPDYFYGFYVGAGGFPGAPMRFRHCTTIASNLAGEPAIERAVDVAFRGTMVIDYDNCTSIHPAVKGFELENLITSTLRGCGVFMPVVTGTPGTNEGGFHFTGTTDGYGFNAMSDCYAVAENFGGMRYGVKFDTAFANAQANSVLGFKVFSAYNPVVIQEFVYDTFVGFSYLFAVGLGCAPFVDTEANMSELAHNITYAVEPTVES